MLLYTHVITALKITSLAPLNIKNTDAYLLGAVLPDVRYLAKVPRETTHLDAPALLRLVTENNLRDRDMVAGYLAHLMADELNKEIVCGLMFPKLPVFLRKIFPIGIQSIMMEVYYQTQRPFVPLIQKDAGKLGDVLGIPPESIIELARRTNEYIKDPSLEQGIKSIAGSHLETNSNIRFYVKIGEFIHNTPSIRNYVLNKISGIKIPLESLLAERVSSHMKKMTFEK